MAKKNLITVDDYKSYKGIRSSSEDLRISSITASVSDFVKSYCNRSFIDYTDASKVEYPELSSATKSFYLLEFPVTEVVSLSVSNDSHITSTTLTEGVDFIIDNTDGAIHRVDGLYFDNCFRSVKVTYKGGMSEIDQSLKLACLDLASYFINSEHKPKMSTGVSIKENFSSGELPTRIPAHIQNTLSLFKN